MKAILLATICLCITATAFAGKSGWDDDLAKSLKKAEAEKKLVLLDFTGSDWCGWCKKIDAEVFSKSDFKSFAKEHLVLVELDFPHNKKLPRKVQQQNETQAKKFNVNGYPTIVLVDAQGKQLKRWDGYSPNLFAELRAACQTEK